MGLLFSFTTALSLRLTFKQPPGPMDSPSESSHLHFPPSVHIQPQPLSPLLWNGQHPSLPKDCHKGFANPLFNPPGFSCCPVPTGLPGLRFHLGSPSTWSHRHTPCSSPLNPPCIPQLLPRTHSACSSDSQRSQMPAGTSSPLGGHPTTQWTLSVRACQIPQLLFHSCQWDSRVLITCFWT